jgi:hypothetical protein
VTAHITRSGIYSQTVGGITVEPIPAWRRRARRAADRALIDAHTYCGTCHEFGGHATDCPKNKNRSAA